MLLGQSVFSKHYGLPCSEERIIFCKDGGEQKKKTKKEEKKEEKKKTEEAFYTITLSQHFS